MLEGCQLDWKGRSVTKCPSCSSTDLASAGARKDQAIVSRCVDCGLGFLNPMPTEDEIALMYSGYFSREDGTGYADYKIDWRGTGLDRLLWDVIERNHTGPRSVLDVGCAFGSRVMYLKKRGLRATGVDISREAVDCGCGKGLDLHACRFEDFNSDATFDVVTMIDFVEHLNLPGTWAAKLESLTHRNSLVAILTPDFDCYFDYGERWIGYNLSFEHLLFFNRKSLASVLERFGFTVITSANVRTANPIMSEKRTVDANKGLRRMIKVAHGDRLLAAWRRMNDRLMWRGLVRSDRRENSLLIVAKRL